MRFKLLLARPAAPPTWLAQRLHPDPKAAKDRYLMQSFESGPRLGLRLERQRHAASSNQLIHHLGHHPGPGYWVMERNTPSSRCGHEMSSAVQGPPRGPESISPSSNYSSMIAQGGYTDLLAVEGSSRSLPVWWTAKTSALLGLCELV